MGEKGKSTFTIILDIMEVVLLTATIVILFATKPCCKVEKLLAKEDIQKEEMYRKIYNDHRLQKLKRDNAMLEDSIQTITECNARGIKYIVVKDTVYISDTVFLNTCGL